MTSPLDIIPIPGHPGMFNRRAWVEAWQAAGSPPINNNSAGRLYGIQKMFYDGWRAGLPGFNPADNPDDERQRLAHVRFVAGDINPTPDRVRRLEAAGLKRPYSYEPWHWELPNVRSYAIVRSIPSTAGGGAASAPSTSPIKRVGKNVIYVGRTDDGLVVSIPEGGKVHDFASPDEYNLNRDTIAVVNSKLPAEYRTVQPPALKDVVFMSRDKLNLLIKTHGAHS